MGIEGWRGKAQDRRLVEANSIGGQGSRRAVEPGGVVVVVVVEGFETQFRILEKQLRLRIFGNRVLRKIFGRKRDEVTRGWVSSHNEEIYNACCSLDVNRTVKSSRIRWIRNVACMSRRGMYAVVLLEIFEGKRHRMKRNIKDTMSGVRFSAGTTVLFFPKITTRSALRLTRPTLILTGDCLPRIEPAGL